MRFNFKKSVLKYIASGLVSIFIGVILSFVLYPYFRDIIEFIYKSEGVVLCGKNFYLFGGTFYRYCFVISCFGFVMSILNESTRLIIIHCVLYLFTFCIALYLLTIKTMSTLLISADCSEGVCCLRYAQLNYDGMLSISLLLAIIPVLLFKSNKIFSYFSFSND